MTATAVELEALVGVCLACLAGVGAIFIGGDAIFIRRFVAYTKYIALILEISKRIFLCDWEAAVAAAICVYYIRWTDATAAAYAKLQN